MLARVLVGVGGALLLSWLVLLVLVWRARPEGGRAREALRLLPDTVRLLRRVAGDREVSRAIRIRLWLLFGYLAMPFDLVPDFIPVIGYADDVVMVTAVLRSIVRRAGPEVIKRHWPGTPEGLAALWRSARLPAAP